MVRDENCKVLMLIAAGVVLERVAAMFDPDYTKGQEDGDHDQQSADDDNVLKSTA